MSGLGGWRRFEGVLLPGGAVLGEDPVDMDAAGFSGEVAFMNCKICGELLGEVPEELLGPEMKDITMSQITPMLDWHMAKHHGVENGGRP